MKNLRRSSLVVFYQQVFDEFFYGSDFLDPVGIGTAETKAIFEITSFSISQGTGNTVGNDSVVTGSQASPGAVDRFLDTGGNVVQEPVPDSSTR